jgi:glycine hydroxymethyltransferase
VDWARFRAIADEVGAYLLVDMAHIAGLVAGGVYPSPVPHADVVTSTTHKTLRGPRGGIILAKRRTRSSRRSSTPRCSRHPGRPADARDRRQGGEFPRGPAAGVRRLPEAGGGERTGMAATFMERGINIVSGGTDNHLMLVDLIGKPYTGKDADAALGAANITVNKNAVPNDPRSPFITSGLRVGTPAITTRGFGESETRELTHWMCDVLEALERRCRADDLAVRAKVLEICARFPGLRRAPRGGCRGGGLSGVCGRRPLNHALPLLRCRGHQGHRFAPRVRGRAGAPAPRVPVLPRALHHLRGGGTGHAAGDQAGRQPRTLQR